MPDYRVAFEDGRIGRSRDHPPITVRAEHLDGLAQAVYDHVWRYLGSRYPEVMIDQAEDEDVATGCVFAGFHTVARFTVTEENPA